MLNHSIQIGRGTRNPQASDGLLDGELYYNKSTNKLFIGDENTVINIQGPTGPTGPTGPAGPGRLVGPTFDLVIQYDINTHDDSYRVDVDWIDGYNIRHSTSAIIYSQDVSDKGDTSLYIDNIYCLIRVSCTDTVNIEVDCDTHDLILCNYFKPNPYPQPAEMITAFLRNGDKIENANAYDVIIKNLTSYDSTPYIYMNMIQ